MDNFVETIAGTTIKFTIPPYRVFVVRRAGKEDVTLAAHVITYDSEQLLLFKDYIQDPQLGLQLVIRRIFNGYKDVEETMIALSGASSH